METQTETDTKATEIQDAPSGEFSATFDPADNKLRLRAARRLPLDLYQRVRDAGFIFAPKQDLFVAPTWTPEREDFLIELCGDIGDEDTSLVERAEERAERFDDYREKRATDADRAHKAVAAIADNIPLGQPILVGHHSERHARRDAERIRNGMQKAVKMWETSNYWKARAAGALRHAKYLERPDVRHRRIKKLESELRKEEKRLKTSEALMKVWGTAGLTLEQAKWIANRDHVHLRPTDERPYRHSLWSELEDGHMTPAQAAEIAIPHHDRVITNAERWIEHLTHRLEYEGAMLGESGGIAGDKFEIEVGGQARCRWGWGAVVRVNRKGGKIVSLRIAGHGVRQVEEITDYRAPVRDEAARVAAAMKQPPLCNYPGPGFHHITKAQWTATYKDYKGSRELGVGADRAEAGSGRPDINPEQAAPAPVARHRVRTVCGHVVGVRGAYGLVPVFIVDAKVTRPAAADVLEAPSLPAPDLDPIPQPRPERPRDERGERFGALREQLRTGGVQVVVADQLFPTPPDLARRMADLAGCLAGMLVLEPSAGTGNLIRAAQNSATGFDCGLRVVAVEQNAQLAEGLRVMRQRTLYANEENFKVLCGDFLACPTGELGPFDRILMNPPFERGADIKHILRARRMLKPGGLLVAICANGPRQQATLKPMAETWEELPEGTFAGTGVRAVLLTMQAS